MKTADLPSFGIAAIKSVAAYGPTMMEFTAADGYVDKMMIPDLAPPGVYDNSELWHNTAHATAKLLLKARDIAVIRDGVRLPYWRNDLDAWIGETDCGGNLSSDLAEFCSQTDHCDLEFSPGAEDTEALCDALVAAGSREIEA